MHPNQSTHCKKQLKKKKKAREVITTHLANLSPFAVGLFKLLCFLVSSLMWAGRFCLQQGIGLAYLLLFHAWPDSPSLVRQSCRVWGFAITNSTIMDISALFLSLLLFCSSGCVPQLEVVSESVTGLMVLSVFCWVGTEILNRLRVPAANKYSCNPLSFTRHFPYIFPVNPEARSSHLPCPAGEGREPRGGRCAQVERRAGK